jgi:hypothetical protein
MPDATRQERSALADLVAARKRFQNAISDNADNLARREKERSEQADLSEGMLKKIAEFRDEAKAARDFVKKALERQRDLAREAGSSSPARRQVLAQNEDALRRSLAEFREEHPRAFQGAEDEVEAAGKALAQAAESLRKAQSTAQGNANKAADRLEAVHDKVSDQSHRRELADGYRLRQMLDDLIRKLASLEARPNALSSKQIREAAADAKEVAAQLKKIAETSPTRDDFGDPLREALSDKNQQTLNGQCNGLGQAQDSDGKQKAAGEAKASLQMIADAFDASRPGALVRMKKSDPLKPGILEALDRGLRQLEGLAEDGGEGRRLSAGDESKRRGEAMANLADGIYGNFGYNENSRAVVRAIERELRTTKVPVDVRAIERLIGDLERRRVESTVAGDKKPESPQGTFSDPARLPPAYREKIEKYYEKLSEIK